MSRMDDAKHLTTVARVQVTLEIPVRGTWGADCALGQVYVQAKDEAEGIIRRVFAEDRVTVVGEPVILAVTSAGRAR